MRTNATLEGLDARMTRRAVGGVVAGLVEVAERIVDAEDGPA